MIRIEDYLGAPQQFFFTPDYLAGTPEANEIGNVKSNPGQGGGVKIDNVTSDPPPPLCFLSGTQLATPKGPIIVDDLQVGDRLVTGMGEDAPIKWISSSMHVWDQLPHKSKPVQISAGALGPQTPSEDLIVSPQHHILFRSPLCHQLFGEHEVLVPAKGLTGLPGVRAMSGKRSAEYYHVMTEEHEILIAHGVETESFYPGPTAVRMLNTGQRASLFAVVPALRDDPENGYGPTARKRITRRQAEQLVDAIKARAKQKKAVVD